MNIAIDGRALQDQPWTGVGYYTYNLLRALFEIDKDNGYHIFFNAFGKLDVPEFKEFSNVTIHRFKWPNKLLNLSIKVRQRPKMDQLINADVFFIPNINFCAFSFDTKVVSVAHDLYFEHFPEYAKFKTRLWHKAIKPKALFEKSKQVIAVSEHTKGDLTETYGIPQKKISVVYPGVSQMQIANRGSYILYFGALETRKNIAGLIEAYELLKDPPELVLAGCSSAYAVELKKKIKKSKRKDKIKLIENPDEQKKKELYAGAGLFVYPSFYEGFGFPPLEAMFAGVPVVASSAASVPEICKSAALLVNPFNIQEIKQGMKIMLEDHELKHKYIQAGYERVRQFSWSECARQTLDILRKTVSLP